MAQKPKVLPKAVPMSKFNLGMAGKVLAQNPPGRKKYTTKTRIST